VVMQSLCVLCVNYVILCNGLVVFNVCAWQIL
jgi:hypothetical protein